MEFKKIFMVFFIFILVLFVYLSLGWENGDNYLLVNFGFEMDVVEVVFLVF